MRTLKIILITSLAALFLTNIAEAHRIHAPASISYPDAPSGPGLPSPTLRDPSPIAWTGGFWGGKGSYGWVQHSPKVYLIFWGPKWQNDQTGIVAGEQALFNELAGSSWGKILGQYGIRDNTQLLGTYIDLKAPPTRKINASLIANELSRVSHLQGWRTARNVQWVVIPQQNTNMVEFRNRTQCAEHDWLWAGKHRYVTDVIPDLQDSGTCRWAYGASPNGSNARADNDPNLLVYSMTSITSHEFAEAATDTWNGWATGALFGLEVADQCAYYSTVPADMTVNVTYLWSDSLHSKKGCIA